MKNEKGFSLLEVVIALALLGMIGVAFLGALATASKAVFLADEQATAESLARTEMEYIKNQGYSTVPWEFILPLHTPSNPPPNPPSWWDDADPPTLPSGYTGYSVEISAEDFDGDNDGDIDSDDEGIRRVTVAVSHQAKPEEVVIVEGYKVDR